MVRYVRFVALTYYNLGAAIGYFDIDFETTSTFDQDSVICPSKITWIYRSLQCNILSTFKCMHVIAWDILTLEWIWQ